MCLIQNVNKSGYFSKKIIRTFLTSIIFSLKIGTLVCNRGDTYVLHVLQYHGGPQTRKLGQFPITIVCNS